MSKIGRMAGLLAILFKLGPKIISLFLKFGLAAGSMVTYAVLFTWQFAILIMVSLFVHESGHIWAMKQMGMKTKGIYFIPFMGAAAVADSAFPSRGAETYTAFMGPVVGFVLALITLGVYWITNNPLFAAAASWMALVNLFNLLPINPLDGGRITKSIAFSVNSQLGLIFLVIGVILMVALIIYLKIYLFLLLLIVSVIELVFEYRKMAHTSTGADLGYLSRMVKESKDLVAKYPGDRGYQDRLDMWRAKYKESSGGSMDMSLPQVAVSIASYVLLVLALYFIMYLTQHIPSAGSAMNVLVG